MLRPKKIKINKEKAYEIKSFFSILKDERSVKYHLEKNDYFGTVATIISLIFQKLKTEEVLSQADKKQLLQTLKNLEKDLVFLQKNHQIYIKPKIKNRKIIPKGKLKSQ
ncbi:hypothetical protein JXK06_00445 [Patescibacteria group bacterium]|nr:hypothetical protein [Patescibacteria group bacterium]